MDTKNDPLVSLGRRERKKMETRRAIRGAALTLALDRGVENVTVLEVSEAADVSQRTFFNYFSCKDDALVMDATGIGAEVRTRIAARPDDESPLRTLRTVIIDSDFLAVMQADRSQLLSRQRLVQEHSSLMSRQMAQFATVERAFAEALAERLGVEVDEDLRPALLAALAVSVLRVAIRWWTADGSQPLDTLINSAFDLLGQADVLGHDDA